MVAHVEMPALDKTPGPATFSHPVVTGLLREQLGFQGLIVSDAMNMNAVTLLGTSGENAVKAFSAGIDVILDSPDTMDRVPRAQGGSRIGADPARASGSVGPPRSDGESAAWPASHACGESRQGAAGRRLASPRGHGAAGERSRDHLDQGRTWQRSAQARADGERPVSLGARLPGPVAHRGAESHADSGAARALARHRSRRDFRSDDGERAGARQGDGESVRRDRCRRVRARLVRQRPTRSGGAGRAVAAGSRAGECAAGDSRL